MIVRRFALIRAVLLSLALVASIPGTVGAQSFTNPLGCGAQPTDFRVTTFRSGLNFPYGMHRLADGSLLVATSRPNTSTSGYFDSVGELLRLVDTNGDGVADGSPAVLATGLPAALTALRVIGPLVLVTSVFDGILVLRQGATPADPLSLVGMLQFSFPGSWEHGSYELAVRPSPIIAGSWELFFNMGSKENDVTTASTDVVVATAIGSVVYRAGGVTYSNAALPESLNGDSIYRVTVTDLATTVELSGLTRIASGLRNAAGIAVRAVGDASDGLYFEDNGIDGSPDPNVSLSADEMNRIATADIGTAVYDFGFADNYIRYSDGTFVGGGGIAPLVAFRPLNDSKSEGPAQIAIAPPNFPVGLNNGVFVGFHGRFDEGGLANDENPLVFWSLDTGTYCHFISNDEPNVGHLDGLLSTDSALFVADMASAGSTNGPGGTGVIYQIARRVPDLVESVVTAPSGTLRAGDRLVASDTVANQGVAAAAASTTRYYLSPTPAKSSSATLLTGGRAVPALPPGQASPGSATVVIPKNTAAGTYYLIACADDPGAVVEGNETNNCRASSTTLKVVHGNAKK